MRALCTAALLSLDFLIVLSQPLQFVHILKGQPSPRVQEGCCRIPEQPVPHRFPQLRSAVFDIVPSTQTEDGLQPLPLLQRTRLTPDERGPPHSMGRIADQF